MSDNFKKQALFEKNRKSIGLAYLLWATLGWLGIHRFYAGRTKSGAIRLLMLIIPVLGWTIALGLWIIDLFLIPSMINEENTKTIELLNAGDSDVPVQPAMRQPLAPAQEPEPLASPADRRRQEMLEDIRQTGYKKEHRDRNPLFR